MKRIGISITLVTLLTATGCAGGDTEPGDERGHVGEAGETIINGDPISAEGSGYVWYGTSVGYCSGTLMTNGWVLTARHCFSSGDVAAPGGITVTMGSQISAAANVVLYGYDDVAMMYLAHPFAMNGSTTGFGRSLYPWATSTLQPGTLLACRGYGINDWNANSGAGTLRAADLAVRGVNFLWWGKHYDLAVDENGRGQYLAFGDSGGSCLFTLASGEQLVAGVTSTVYHGGDGTFDGLVDPDQFRSWYAQVLAGNDLYFSSGDARRVTSDGDWHPGSYKAECGASEGVVGVSRFTNAPTMHAALCSSAWQFNRGPCHDVDFSSGDARWTTSTGDWDWGFYKGECGASEFAAGISQTPSGQVDSILCCSGAVAHNACTAHVFDAGDARESTARGDWDNGFYKGECGPDRYVAGVSRNTSTGSPHAILCCSY